MKKGWFGLLIGLAAGYLIATLLQEDAPGRARESNEAANQEPVVAGTTPAPDRAQASDWTPPPPVQAPHASFHGNGDITFDGKLLQPRPVDELRKALEWARAHCDWGNFEKAILELGVTGTPEAHALLVELMGDETLRLQGSWIGNYFATFLQDANVPGVLPAARRRAEADMADQPNGRWCRPGWLSLVSLHATEAEIAWLESLATDPARRSEIDAALAAGSGNPAAAERLAARIRTASPPIGIGCLHTFARMNPAAAFRSAVEILPTASVTKRHYMLDTMLGDATTDATLAEAASVLNALESQQDRLTAIGSVERIRRRGLDVSGFQPLLDDLRVILERANGGALSTGDRFVSDALSIIGSKRVAWNEPTLNALRTLAALPSEEAQKTLHTIEKRRRDAERGWNPERG